MGSQREDDSISSSTDTTERMREGDVHPDGYDDMSEGFESNRQVDSSATEAVWYKRWYARVITYYGFENRPDLVY